MYCRNPFFGAIVHNMYIVCLAFSSCHCELKLKEQKLFSLSVDSASGAFATTDEGTVMDTGGKKMMTITYDLVHVECCVVNIYSLLCVSKRKLQMPSMSLILS